MVAWLHMYICTLRRCCCSKFSAPKFQSGKCGVSTVSSTALSISDFCLVSAFPSTTTTTHSICLDSCSLRTLMWQRVQTRSPTMRHRPFLSSSSSPFSSRPLLVPPPVGGAALRSTIPLRVPTAVWPRQSSALVVRHLSNTSAYRRHPRSCSSSSSGPTVVSQWGVRNSGRHGTRNGSSDTRSPAAAHENVPGRIEGVSRGADDDSAELLRRMATYIEEDSRAADKLGSVVSVGDFTQDRHGAAALALAYYSIQGNVVHRGWCVVQHLRESSINSIIQQ